MALPIISADERIRETRSAKVVLLGFPGVGKTSQLKTLPEEVTLFVDLEAGDIAVQDWHGDTIRPRAWPEFRDLVVFLAGPNPSAAADQAFSQAHFEAVCQKYGDPNQLAKYRYYFVDSITVLSRLCFAWSKSLTLRLIKVVLPSGQIEVLATSLLDTTHFPAEAFAELYHARWSIEEAFKVLKHRLYLEQFTGELPESIRQDILAKLFTANLAPSPGA